ncbi:MAG: type I methionyl aminopeptidase [Acetanaerobacterium sp.]
MIVIKNKTELDAMSTACRISAGALKAGGEVVQPGVTTGEIDRIIHRYILKQGAKPSFLGYGGFPASACVSVNNEVIHGIPSDRVIRQGDIVSIDVGACIDGYHGDNAATFPVGEISADAQRLLDTTRESLYAGIQAARAGARVGDIGSAVQSYCESRGFGVVRKYVGHGVGRDLHEAPDVPNYGTAGRGIRLIPGMTIAIEPMINQTSADVRVLANHWTVVTADAGLSAHFEHTIAITSEGPVILTTP